MAPLGAAHSASLPELDPAELEALLNLMLLPRTGDITIRRLLATHNSFARALAQRTKDLGEAALTALASEAHHERVARALRDIELLGVTVLVQSHAAYPERLLHLHAPPTALFLIGDVDLLRGDCVSIVGARSCTPYGERVTAELAADLAGAGVVVCSGMALGIDSAAHVATLDAGGGTIAVLGCGVERCYPRSNRPLYRRIAEHGLLVSEFVPGEHVKPDHFPRRNRIIAALSRAVLIVEASFKSGSLITADHALDIGRDVFAVPGPVGFQQSEGTNKLIQEGARLVASSADVLRELGLAVPAPGRNIRGRFTEPPPDLPSDLRSAWDALAQAPRHVDEIARTCGLPSSRVLTLLLDLELAGYAKHLAGMQYVRA